MKLQFSDTMKQWDGEGGWFYIRVPKEHYSDLQELGAHYGRGFGAIKVRPTIGKSTWETSIFPDSSDKSYLLFIKKAIRKSESLSLDDVLSCELEIIE